MFCIKFKKRVMFSFSFSIASLVHPPELFYYTIVHNIAQHLLLIRWCPAKILPLSSEPQLRSSTPLNFPPINKLFPSTSLCPASQSPSFHLSSSVLPSLAFLFVLHHHSSSILYLCLDWFCLLTARSCTAFRQLFNPLEICMLLCFFWSDDIHARKNLELSV